MRRKYNHTQKGLQSRRGTTFPSLALPDGRTSCISSAVAKKQPFLTMKEPGSQFSSLGQSHKELILESALVFISGCSAHSVWSHGGSQHSGPSGHPRKLSDPLRGFSNANEASVRGPAVPSSG